MKKPLNRHTDGDACAPACTCCYGLLIDVTGTDVHRLATSLQLDPSVLVTKCSSEELDDDLGFCLEPAGATFTLVLRQRGTTRRRCALLIGPLAGTGQTRCGVYADRPAACRAYPAEIAPALPDGTPVAGGRVQRRSIARCPLGAFGALAGSLADLSPPADLSPARDDAGSDNAGSVDIDGEFPDAALTAAMDDAIWRPQLRDEQIGVDLHRIVTWRWNRHVLVADRRFRIGEFLAYLIDVHDRLSEAWKGLQRRRDWPALREAWGRALDDGTSPFLSPPGDTPELAPIHPVLRRIVATVEG